MYQNEVPGKRECKHFPFRFYEGYFYHPVKVSYTFQFKSLICYSLRTWFRFNYRGSHVTQYIWSGIKANCLFAASIFLTLSQLLCLGLVLVVVQCNCSATYLLLCLFGLLHMKGREEGYSWGDLLFPSKGKDGTFLTMNHATFQRLIPDVVQSLLLPLFRYSFSKICNFGQGEGKRGGTWLNN